MIRNENGVFPTITEYGIYGFFAEYRTFSNFHEAPLEVFGGRYLCSEAAYMSQKSTDPDVRAQFQNLAGVAAKRLGRKVTLREDWEAVKNDIMYQVLKAKFTQSAELREQLLATGNLYLEETNYWKDTYWGVCNGVGRNMLGLLLMRVRNEIRQQQNQQASLF